MAQNGQRRPSSGDHTGRQKQQDARTQSEAVKDRQREISMATAIENEEEQHGVFDPQSGERLDFDEVGSPRVAYVEEVDVAPNGLLAGYRPNAEPVLTGKEAPEDIEPVLAARQAFTQPPTEMVYSPFVQIRVDADIEKMTYGMVNGEPNNYDFKEGLQYRVPREVAEHLNERNLVRQWMG